MSKLAIFSIIMGLVGFAIGIFAMSPYNELGPYSHIIGGGLPFALLLCGLGISFILLGLWLARRSKWSSTTRKALEEMPERMRELM